MGLFRGFPATFWASGASPSYAAAVAVAMKKVTTDDVPNEPHELGANSVRRNVSDALGTQYLAAVFYELEPGEQLSGGLHAHHDQEEVFFVLEGRLTFEYSLDRATVAVATGEVIRFEQGEFQCGRNRSDDRAVVLALGAPVPASSASETEWLTRCPECDAETLHEVVSHDGGTIVSRCTACGTEQSS